MQFCRTAQNALHITPWQTCSTEHRFDFYVKNSATLQSMREDYSYTTINTVYDQVQIKHTVE